MVLKLKIANSVGPTLRFAFSLRAQGSEFLMLNTPLSWTCQICIIKLYHSRLQEPKLFRNSNLAGVRVLTQSKYGDLFWRGVLLATSSPGLDSWRLRKVPCNRCLPGFHGFWQAISRRGGERSGQDVRCEIQPQLAASTAPVGCGSNRHGCGSTSDGMATSPRSKTGRWLTSLGGGLVQRFNDGGYTGAGLQISAMWMRYAEHVFELFIETEKKHQTRSARVSTYTQIMCFLHASMIKYVHITFI